MKKEINVANQEFSVKTARTKFFDGWRKFSGGAGVGAFLSGDNLYPLFGVLFDSLENNPNGFGEIVKNGQGVDYLCNLYEGRHLNDWQGLGFLPEHEKNGWLKDEALEKPEKSADYKSYIAETEMKRAAALAGFVNITSKMISCVDDYDNRPDRAFVDVKMGESRDKDNFGLVMEEWEKLSEENPGYKELDQEESLIVQAMGKARLAVMVDALRTVETGKWPEKKEEDGKNTLEEVFYIAFERLLNQYPWDG